MRLFFISCFLAGACALYSCDAKKTDKVPAHPTSTDSSRPVIENRTNPYVIVDVSPMDMAWFPADYPKIKMDTPSIAPPLARVIYSRPHLQGRSLFHDLLKYGEPWRLGANESTELDLYRDAFIQNKKIKAGRYVLYCIPEANEWTIVLNGNIDSWGLHQDTAKDVERFVIPVTQTNNHIEYFTMLFQPKEKNTDLLMAWDNVEARLAINFVNN